MNDRQLLKLAAKAAGIEWDEEAGHGWRLVDGLWTVWNARDDDGDALRLAVKLKIDFNHDMKLGLEIVYASAQGTLWSQASEEKLGADPYAATRRAIVRAAAEIGKEMP